MQIKEFSTRVVTFKLAAALEKYELDLRALAADWLDAECLQRVQHDFGELRILGASLPRLSVAWVAVLVSRARFVQSLWGPAVSVRAILDEHLRAVESLRKRCLLTIGARRYSFNRPSGVAKLSS